MITKKINLISSDFANNFAKKATIFSLVLLGLSCTTDESIEEISYNAKSSSSISLSISDVEASITKSGYPATNVLDGSTSTRWAGKGDDVEFTITLATESLIDYLNIAFPSGNSRVYGYIMYTSTDNSSWTQVKDSQSSGTTTALEEIDVTNSTAKYIKLVLKGSDTNTWNYISEVEVYGTAGEVSTEEEETASSSNGIVDFGDLDVETSWISEDKYDRDTFDASDVDDKEWMDVYDSGLVVMKCLAADGHRTELKEKSGVESSLQTYKNMNYTATLTSIPSHGVTIAQIHNRGGVKRPWIRVYVDADRYIKIKATATTPDEDTSTYDDVYVGPKYTSGDEFSINVITQNGKASFEITTNGDTYNETLTPSDDWDAFSNHYYLKAGVYTEGEDTQPQMNLSSFSINY